MYVLPGGYGTPSYIHTQGVVELVLSVVVVVGGVDTEVVVVTVSVVVGTVRKKKEKDRLIKCTLIDLSVIKCHFRFFHPLLHFSTANLLQTCCSHILFTCMYSAAAHHSLRYNMFPDGDNRGSYPCNVWSTAQPHVVCIERAFDRVTTQNQLGEKEIVLSPSNRKCLHKDLHARITRYYFNQSCRLKHIERDFWYLFNMVKLTWDFRG